MRKFKNCAISFGIVIIIMFILLNICNYTPFGNNSFATLDADIQYMDFFSYLKNILEGTNSAVYSFSYTLGGTAIGLISYYLFSPLNLLIVFFSKANLQVFFNVIVVLKLAISAFTFSYYLGERFNYKIKTTYNILLSVCYALMQYNLTQASNIMWLDGVYMLPLIALGIYKLVNKKQIHFLSISVGLSIIFNWYTGGINCIFSVFWFFVEYIVYLLENVKEKRNREKLKRFVKCGLFFVVAMIIGVMISAAIFLPSVLVQRNGRGASFDWHKFTMEFKGNMLMTIQHYCLGAISRYNALSFFCGSIPLIGGLGYFTSKTIKAKTKIIFGIILLISIMFCYWQPMFCVFSLFLDAASYWFRYSYIVSFAFIFIAANYYKNIEEEKNSKLIVCGAFVFSYLLLLFNYTNPMYANENIIATIFFILINIVCIILSKNINNKKVKQMINIFLIICVSTELLCNGSILMNLIKFTSVNDYNNYVLNQSKLINEIKNSDDGFYRISQIKNRVRQANGLGAYYNESLAYNYMSNASYTSSPDAAQINFIDRLGYKKQEDRITTVNTSIIAADSLLGVKYILSDYDIKGLIKLNGYPENDGKSVYLNPYVLPMAFKYNSLENNSVVEYTNEFEYVNELYSALYGEEIELYEKIEFNKKTEENGAKVIYEIDVPRGNYALYGNIVYNDSFTKTLNVNDVYSTAYNCWLAPGVFYIPTKEEGNAYIEVTSDAQINFEESELFYCLNLDKLKEVSDKINSNIVTDLSINNGIVKCTVNGNEQESLFLSVANSDGWIVKLNGKKVEVQEFAECLVTVPLENGQNEIVLEYRIPGLMAGIIISFFGVALLIFVKFKLK